jgi:hypothetical protein
MSPRGIVTTSSSSGADVFVLVQSNVTKKITNTNLFTGVTLTSPTLVTPVLGVATATSINKVAFTAPATGATLTIANGKTLTANNSVTFVGTDATTMTFPSTSASIARTDAAQTFTGTQTFAGAVVGSVQALSGPGAVNVTTLTTTLHPQQLLVRCTSITRTASFRAELETKLHQAAGQLLWPIVLTDLT